MLAKGVRSRLCLFWGGRAPLFMLFHNRFGLVGSCSWRERRVIRSRRFSSLPRSHVPHRTRRARQRKNPRPFSFFLCWKKISAGHGRRKENWRSGNGQRACGARPRHNRNAQTSGGAKRRTVGEFSRGAEEIHLKKSKRHPEKMSAAAVLSALRTADIWGARHARCRRSHASPSRQTKQRSLDLFSK